MAENSKILELDTMFTKVLEAFNCSICLGDLRNTFVTTKCAHRFCEECIKQSITEFHKCPLCNHPLDLNDVIKDAQFESLKTEIEALRRIKMDQIYKKLTEPFTLDQNNNQNENFNSSLDEVLKKHLVKNLQTHQNYTNQLKAHYKFEVEKLKELNEKKIAILKNHSEIQKIREEESVQIANLKQELDTQLELISKHYDKFLDQIKLEPLSMPVKLRIKIMSKRLDIDGLVLKSNDKIDLVYKFLKEETDKLQNRIVKLENITILCLGPLSHLKYEEIESIYEAYTLTGELPENVCLIKANDSFPVLEYSLKTNSELAVFGTVLFENDLPKQCYKCTFVKENPKPVDYYTCKTCDKLNWICKNCIEICHKGHEIRIFSLNHKPDRNCCYCERKDCKLKDIITI